MISVIDSIAFQTNILALNAEGEAALACKQVAGLLSSLLVCNLGEHWRD